ncbi:MAG: class I SAM-dependent methyltransferase [Nocardioides sp.]
MDSDPEATAKVARVFDEIAEDYDQSGVRFFGPIAQGLVEQLAPVPGEAVLDVGCGRGAATFAAADRVGPAGSVLAVDIAPQMVELTRRRARELRLPQVHAKTISADDLGVVDGSIDVLVSSLVLFFAPDPLATLGVWMRALAPGGRIGLATFGDAGAAWKRIDDLFRPFLPAALLDARTTGAEGPFATDQGVENLLFAAGAQEVRTVVRPLRVLFDDAAQWRRFSMSTGQRAFWRFIPEGQHDELMAKASATLQDARDSEGHIALTQDIRYTLGLAPRHPAE